MRRNNDSPVVSADIKCWCEPVSSMCNGVYDVKLLAKADEILDVDHFVLQLGGGSDWHEKFSGCKVAQKLQLPTISLRLPAHPNRLSMVTKQGVRQLMRHGKPDPSRRVVRVEFNPDSRGPGRNQSRVRDVIPGHHWNS